jgi:Activator of Hsp90 ATPase homolog 1-like protein
MEPIVEPSDLDAPCEAGVFVSYELSRHEHLFRVIDRPRRLLVDTTETRLDGSSLEFETEFTFEERDGRTLMTMIQRGFPTAEPRDEDRVGLPNAFARLARAVGF